MSILLWNVTGASIDSTLKWGFRIRREGISLLLMYFPFILELYAVFMTIGISIFDLIPAIHQRQISLRKVQARKHLIARRYFMETI